MAATDLQLAPRAEELSHEALAFAVPAEWLGFATTAEISTDGEWAGQERALAALELGLRVRHAGFNIYVCGLTGTHRERELAALLRRFTGEQSTPGDRVLVQNFRNRDHPRALYLPAGWGVRLRQDLRELIEELRRVLPTTFREETFEEEKQRLSEQFGEQGEAISRQLAEHAAQAGFALQPGPGGEVVFIPLKDGHPMEPKELESLDAREQNDLKRRQRELGREVKSVIRQQHTLFGKLARERLTVEAPRSPPKSTQTFILPDTSRESLARGRLSRWKVKPFHAALPGRVHALPVEPVRGNRALN